jgi:ABC-type sugar transport system ATPase subunit
MALIRTLADEGVAVVLVTHEARHAAWADRVIFLRDGRLVDESQVPRAMASPERRTVLVGVSGVVHANITTGHVSGCR